MTQQDTPVARLRPATWTQTDDAHVADPGGVQLLAAPQSARLEGGKLVFPKAAYPTADDARRSLGQIYPALAYADANPDGTYNIYDVDVFSTGKWNNDVYTREDLQDMVDADREIGAHVKPFMKYGHDEKQAYAASAGLPAAGWVRNLRLVGDKLKADLMQVPAKVYSALETKQWRTRSPEIYWDMRFSGNGRTYRRVLRAVALLGAELPANPTLDDVFHAYGADDTVSAAELRVYEDDAAAPLAPALPLTPEADTRRGTDAVGAPLPFVVGSATGVFRTAPTPKVLAELRAVAEKNGMLPAFEAWVQGVQAYADLALGARGELDLPSGFVAFDDPQDTVALKFAFLSALTGKSPTVLRQEWWSGLKQPGGDNAPGMTAASRLLDETPDTDGQGALVTRVRRKLAEYAEREARQGTAGAGGKLATSPAADMLGWMDEGAGDPVPAVSNAEFLRRLRAITGQLVPGIPIRLEFPVGSVRFGHRPDGSVWRRPVVYEYGEIVGTHGVDGDAVDCLIGPNPAAPLAFVVHALKPGSGEYDEDKVLLGWNTLDDARGGYLTMWAPETLRSVTAMPTEQLIASLAELPGERLYDDGGEDAELHAYAYNPNQMRDPHGRWTSGPGGGWNFGAQAAHHQGLAASTPAGIERQKHLATAHGALAAESLKLGDQQGAADSLKNLFNSVTAMRIAALKARQAGAPDAQDKADTHEYYKGMLAHLKDAASTMTPVQGVYHMGGNPQIAGAPAAPAAPAPATPAPAAPTPAPAAPAPAPAPTPASAATGMPPRIDLSGAPDLTVTLQRLVAQQGRARLPADRAILQEQVSFIHAHSMMRDGPTSRTQLAGLANALDADHQLLVLKPGARYLFAPGDRAAQAHVEEAMRAVAPLAAHAYSMGLSEPAATQMMAWAANRGVLTGGDMSAGATLAVRLRLAGSTINALRDGNPGSAGISYGSMVRQMAIMNDSPNVPDEQKQMLADALVRVHQAYGQFGHPIPPAPLPPANAAAVRQLYARGHFGPMVQSSPTLTSFVPRPTSGAAAPAPAAPAPSAPAPAPVAPTPAAAPTPAPAAPTPAPAPAAATSGPLAGMPPGASRTQIERTHTLLSRLKQSVDDFTGAHAAGDVTAMNAALAGMRPALTNLRTRQYAAGLSADDVAHARWASDQAKEIRGRLDSTSLPHVQAAKTALGELIAHHAPGSALHTAAQPAAAHAAATGAAVSPTPTSPPRLSAAQLQAGAAAAAAVTPRPATVAPAALGPRTLSYADATATQTGGQTGSNPGGFFTTAAGTPVYVKDYSDAGQAYSEHVSTKVYDLLGVPVPKSSLAARPGGGISHVSDIVPGSAPTMTAAAARQVLGGFAADVLLANWDVIGTSNGNLNKAADGKIYRIDGGGALLFRARNGRKAGVGYNHNDIGELDTLFNSARNPAYSAMASRAGVSNWRDVPGIADQIGAIRDRLTDDHINALSQSIVGVPPADQQAVASMLRARRDALVALLPQVQAQPGATTPAGAPVPGAATGATVPAPAPAAPRTTRSSRAAPAAAAAPAASVPAHLPQATHDAHAAALAYARTTPGWAEVQARPPVPAITTPQQFETQFRRIARRSGMRKASVDALLNNPSERQRAFDRYQAYMQQGSLTPVHRTSPATFALIAQSGRLKSQHETGTSGGSYSPAARLSSESNMGLWPVLRPGQTRDVTRAPIFGALTPGSTHQPPPEHKYTARGYGSVMLEFHPHVAQRATAYFKNSLNSASTGKLISPAEAAVMYAGNSYVNTDQHAEMQWPGGLSMHDVRSIALDERDQGQAAGVRRQLDNAGFGHVPIYIINQQRGRTLHSGPALP